MRRQKRHISLKDHPNISPEVKEQVKKLAEESGYRRIAYIAGPSYLNISSGRERGYIDGLKENHIEFNKDYLVQCEMNPGSATEATWKLLALPDPPDAIFGINDTVAFAAMKEIRRQGVRILSPIPLLKWVNSWLSFSLKAWSA